MLKVVERIVHSIYCLESFQFVFPVLKLITMTNQACPSPPFYVCNCVCAEGCCLSGNECKEVCVNKLAMNVCYLINGLRGKSQPL